jgi:hypothetical protein
MADFRFAIGLSCLAFFFIVLLIERKKQKNRNKREVAYGIFVLVTYLTWLVVFSIYRYAIALEVLMVPCVLILSRRVISDQSRLLVGSVGSIFFVVFLMLTTSYPDWGRVSFKKNLLSVEKEERKIPDGTLVVFLGNPLGYLAPILNKETKNVSYLGLNYFTDANEQFNLGKEVRSRLASHKGHVIAIVSASNVTDMLLPQKYGYQFDVNQTWRFSTPTDEYLCAPLIPFLPMDPEVSVDSLFSN